MHSPIDNRGVVRLAIGVKCPIDVLRSLSRFLNEVEIIDTSTNLIIDLDKEAIMIKN